MLLQKRIHPIVAAADSNKSRVALRSFFVNIKAVIRFVDFETCAYRLSAHLAPSLAGTQHYIKE